MKNYAVNLASKHHRLLEEGERPLDNETVVTANETVVTANADGWIEWSGGECPLPKHVKCDHIMRFTPERDAFVVGLAGHLRWTHENLSGDIIAYRPTIDQPASEEPKEWDGAGLPPVGEKILVRKNDNDWLTVEVVAHDDGGIIYRDPSRTDHKYKWAIGGGIRPLPSPRDQWIKAARKSIEGSLNGKTGLEIIYDAMIDGKLPVPGGEQCTR